MKSLIAQRHALPRSRETVYAEIQEQRVIVDMWVNLAMEFLNIDTRPLVFDGNSCERIGPNPVPLEVQDNIATEQRRLAELEYELHQAHELWSRT